MADQNPEVRIKLIIDDQSAATLERVRGGFVDVQRETEKAAAGAAHLGGKIAQVGEHEKHAKAGVDGMSLEVLKGNVYFELMKKGVEGVVEVVRQGVEATEKLAEAALEASDAQEKQERQMSGFLLLMDGGKHSMQELRAYTADQREEFEAFGMKAGVAVKDLVGAYDKLIERNAMSSEKAHELTEQMAIVGKIVPGGVEGLAQGMSGVEMGMVRARNPIVQLIAATHLLKGGARDVAAQMQKMNPEQQMALAEQAINRQADALKRMGALVPTMGELKTSFEGMKESFLESMGAPMMHALVPQLTRLRDYLAEHIEEIKAFGERVGQKAAEIIDYVSEAVEGIYSGIVDNWDSFRNIMGDIFADWGDMWTNAQNVTGGVKASFKDIGKDLLQIFVEISEQVHQMMDGIRTLNDYVHLRHGGYSQTVAAQTAAERAAKDPTKTQAEFFKVLDRYRDTSLESGAEDLEVQQRNYRDLLKLRENIDLSPERAANRKLVNQAEFAPKGGAMGLGSSFESEAAWGSVRDKLVENLANHSDIYNANLLQEIQNSAGGAEALADEHGNLRAGLEGLSTMLEVAAPELDKRIKALAQPGIRNITPPKIEQHFHGGVHVKQNFKDQDANDVLLVFKRGLAHAAENRISARTGTAFGW